MVGFSIVGETEARLRGFLDLLQLKRSGSLKLSSGGGEAKTASWGHAVRMRRYRLLGEGGEKKRPERGCAEENFIIPGETPIVC